MAWQKVNLCLPSRSLAGMLTRICTTAAACWFVLFSGCTMPPSSAPAGPGVLDSERSPAVNERGSEAGVGYPFAPMRQDPRTPRQQELDHELKEALNKANLEGAKEALDDGANPNGFDGDFAALDGRGTVL